MPVYFLRPPRSTVSEPPQIGVLVRLSAGRTAADLDRVMLPADFPSATRIWDAARHASGDPGAVRTREGWARVGLGSARASGSPPPWSCAGSDWALLQAALALRARTDPGPQDAPVERVAARFLGRLDGLDGTASGGSVGTAGPRGRAGAPPGTLADSVGLRWRASLGTRRLRRRFGRASRRGRGDPDAARPRAAAGQRRASGLPGPHPAGLGARAGGARPRDCRRLTCWPGRWSRCRTSWRFFGKDITAGTAGAADPAGARIRPQDAPHPPRDRYAALKIAAALKTATLARTVERPTSAAQNAEMRAEVEPLGGCGAWVVGVACETQNGGGQWPPRPLIIVRSRSRSGRGPCRR